jgi:hypothetical protein
MRLRAALAGVLLVLAGCSSATPSPSATAPLPDGAEPTSPADSAGPDASDPIVGLLAGAWRRTAITLDDRHVAIVSDACSAAARDQLDPDLAELPTVLVDARGLGLATAVFADDLHAVECLARFDAAGEAVTVDLVSELSPKTTAAPAKDDDISVAAYVPDDDGSRTLAFGRVGSAAFAVRLGFDDQSVVNAAMADGWWALWFPKSNARAATISAVDRKSISIGGLPAPDTPIESRIGPAAWWIDPAKPKPNAKSTEIHAQVLELACAGGQASDGRIEDPAIEVTGTTVIVTFAVRHRPGGQDCPSHPSAPFTFELPEPLGGRKLLDGSEDPPRDATIAVQP